MRIRFWLFSCNVSDFATFRVAMCTFAFHAVVKSVFALKERFGLQCDRAVFLAGWRHGRKNAEFRLCLV